jgi:glyoxylase-like metal-dependent hydrolase (beta-lactamase superfamily II)
MTMQKPDLVLQVAEGIYQIRIPLPFALNIVNCYLLDDGDRWTIVDTGLNRPEAQMGWRAAFEALNISPDAIHQIVLTHMHPDHYGMAGWLQRQCPERPPVRMSPREWAAAQGTWIRPHWHDDLLSEHVTRCGVPPDVTAEVVRAGAETAAMTAPHPELVETLEPGSTIYMGKREFTIIEAPGHSDGQLLFYCAGEGLMISGDHVLMKITPNIGIWPHTEPQPLRRYLASLRELRQLDVWLALPGHKSVITDWRGRIGELLAHHDQRLEAMYQAVGSGSTVYEVSQHIFDFGKLTHHEVRFAVAETLAHLEHLRDEERMIREEGEVWVYRKKD